LQYRRKSALGWPEPSCSLEADGATTIFVLITGDCTLAAGVPFCLAPAVAHTPTGGVAPRLAARWPTGVAGGRALAGTALAGLLPTTLHAPLAAAAGGGTCVLPAESA
jgi:hypothetical protein